MSASNSEGFVLAEVAHALLDQVMLLGFAADVAREAELKAAFQHAKTRQAHLLQELNAHMWRLGVPAIDQATNLGATRDAILQLQAGDNAYAALSSKVSDLQEKLNAAIANDQLSAHARNFLTTISSRTHAANEEIRRLTGLSL